MNRVPARAVFVTVCNILSYKEVRQAFTGSGKIGKDFRIRFHGKMTKMDRKSKVILALLIAVLLFGIFALAWRVRSCGVAENLTEFFREQDIATYDFGVVSNGKVCYDYGSMPFLQQRGWHVLFPISEECIADVKNFDVAKWYFCYDAESMAVSCDIPEELIRRIGLETPYNADTGKIVLEHVLVFAKVVDMAKQCFLYIDTKNKVAFFKIIFSYHGLPKDTKMGRKYYDFPVETFEGAGHLE